MEPVIMALVPGLFGGLVLALIIGAIHPRTPAVVVQRRLEWPSPLVINMAHIPVEGVGGLGLVAAVTAVAASDPRIRVAMMAAAVLGAAFAVFLIVLRRRTGGLPTSSGGPGDLFTIRVDRDGRRTHLSGPGAAVDGAAGRGQARCWTPADVRSVIVRS